MKQKFYILTVFESQIDLLSNGSGNALIVTANIRPRKKEKPTFTQNPQIIRETKLSMHSSSKLDNLMPEAQKELISTFEILVLQRVKF